jgi:serine/threonine-protein kinase
MASGNQIRLVTYPPQAGCGSASLQVDAAAVRGQLEKLLASDAFARADRMSRFLRFIVEETLQGRGSQLKEYLIGLEVFDRNGSYDPRTDPVVRGEARRLRSKLIEYYEQQGRGDPVRIHLPKGSYAAMFEIDTTATTDEAPPIARRGPAHSKSIAVLPFLNLSPNPQNQYFSDGLTEEIIHVLGKVSGMRVVARTSAFQYKGTVYDVRQIGEQLHVRTLLEGSVRKSGKRLRVTARLVDAVNGYYVWSETYDRNVVDIFAAQEELSCAIVATLRLHWLGTASSLPWEEYPSSLPGAKISPGAAVFIPTAMHAVGNRAPLPVDG